MSDLAPFVAAALRDKVVSELQDEIRALKLQVERQNIQTQSVTITGPRGKPVYAQASFKEHGKYDYSPELWKVEFPKQPQQQQHEQQTCPLENCLLRDLPDMEIRVGGICKAKLSNGIVEGFVNDVRNNYHPQNKSGALSIWFGGSSGIWLNVCIHPIEQQQYAALRDFDLAGDNLLRILLEFFCEQVQITFTEASFLISYMNGAMTDWGILPSKNGNADDNYDDGDEDEDEDGQNRAYI